MAMPKRIEIENWDPASLKPNPWNSNVVGPEMEKRLEKSIQELDGLYKPIICRELEDGTLQILGGEHRARAAQRLGHFSVPVVNLGRMDDKRAKTIGLIDNGQYGEDDSLKLAEILKDIGDQDLLAILPYDERDLAGIFEATEIDLDMLGLDDDKGDDLPKLEEQARAAITHALMRFKVPVEDQPAVEQFVQHVITKQGLTKEQDSMVAAGMALVAIVKAAREVL